MTPKVRLVDYEFLESIMISDAILA
jgi:hypothetical protein